MATVQLGVMIQRGLASGKPASGDATKAGQLYFETDTGILWHDDGSAWLEVAVDSSGLAAHLADSADAHDASAVSFSPAAGIAATDVQAAIVEDAGDLAAHLADTVDAHDASAISFTPTGTIAATDAQAAIAEVASEAVAAIAAVDTLIDDHIADSAGAHAASAIAFTPAGTIAATTVQAAIEEVASEAGGGGHTIQDDGTPLTARANLNFIPGSSGVTVTDNSGDDATDIDFSALTGGGGVLNNYAATTDPGANDDSGDGYAVGSRWVNTTAGTDWVCVDDTATAAVWEETTAAGGGGSGPEITSGVLASRPTGAENDLYFATDRPILSRKGASVWETYGPLWRLKVPAAADFSRVDSGFAVVGSVVDDGDGIKVVNGGAELEVALGSAPYTVTAAFRHVFRNIDNRYGIYVRDTTSNDGNAFSIYFDPAARARLDRYSYSTFTTLAGVTIVEEETLGWHFFVGGELIWFRIVDDGTNRSYQVSTNPSHGWHIAGTLASTTPAVPNRAGIWTQGVANWGLHCVHWEIT